MIRPREIVLAMLATASFATSPMVRVSYAMDGGGGDDGGGDDGGDDGGGADNGGGGAECGGTDAGAAIGNAIASAATGAGVDAPTANAMGDAGTNAAHAAFDANGDLIDGAVAAASAAGVVARDHGYDTNGALGTAVTQAIEAAVSTF